MITNELEPRSEISDFKDIDLKAVGRRWYGRDWRWYSGMELRPPSAVDLAEFLTPALIGRLGYDGTRGHNRSRQDGFWTRTPEGWHPIEISEVVMMLDSALRAAQDELYETLDELPKAAEAATDAAFSTEELNVEEVKRAGRQREALPGLLDDANLRIDMMGAVRKGLTMGGPYRGQLVAALRDSHAFDLSKADVMEIVGRYLDVAGPAGRGLLAGFARSALAA
jgi:hypothetical protein